MNDVHEGLEGVVVTRTRLSAVDGERGALVIAGRPVEELAGVVGYEELAATLLDGEPPGAERRAAVRAALGRGRALGAARLAEVPSAGARADGMDALRELTAGLSCTDPLELTGAVGYFAAAWAARAAGLAPRAADAGATHAEDLLGIATGRAPRRAAARALEAYLVTVMDHGMNASTFTARVIASTGSDLVSAVTGAIGALKGPLHGGAPGPVLDMLDAIGEPARAAAWLEGELAAGRRIMGMGHRVYRVRDPRAFVLERAVRELGAADGAAEPAAPSPRLALARAVEAAAAALLERRYPARALAANVEFYTAVLLDAVGLDRRAFAPLFAAGRAAGWCAHALEQRARGRLIRPESLYDGPAPGAAPQRAAS